MEQEVVFLDEFFNKYDMSIKELQMKKDHTYRVAMFSKLLASHLNLDLKEQKRAYIIGLFHDLGRFPQYSEYKTFSDEKSIDHGKLGYDILNEIDYKDEIVKKAILQHNKYTIPASYEGILKTHCEIIRDADKLDNLNYDFHPRYTGLKVSEHLISFFKNHILIPNELVQNQLDETLRELSFVFDINLEGTLCLIRNKGIIDKKTNQVYEQTNDTTIFMIGNYINEYINKRIGVKKRERIR